jgi:hypothetical protein
MWCKERHLKYSDVFHSIIIIRENKKGQKVIFGFNTVSVILICNVIPFCTINISFIMSINYSLACSHEEMNPNRRNTMEDVIRVVPVLGGDESMSYFGVYDGHGG